jgi:transmembrane sensor
MNNHPHIPENDIDLRLARSFGEVLVQNRDEATLGDPLFRLLLQARAEAEHREMNIDVAGREQVWQSMQIEKTPLRIGYGWMRVAAVLLISAAIWLVYMFIQPPSVSLVAEAGAERVTIELSDGSMVTLRPNSGLYLEREEPGLSRYSLQGEALFEVVPDAGRLFEVTTGNGRVQVLGTRFLVSDRREVTQVQLLEGSVRVETADGLEGIVLQPGEATRIRTDSRIAEPFTFVPEEATGWTVDRLIFSNREAGSILAELEDHFRITIIAPASVQNEVMGGSIALENAEQTLGDLGSVLGGTFEQTDASTYTFNPDR